MPVSATADPLDGLFSHPVDAVPISYHIVGTAEFLKDAAAS
jgi:hypothetical protein